MRLWILWSCAAVLAGCNSGSGASGRAVRPAGDSDTDTDTDSRRTLTDTGTVDRFSSFPRDDFDCYAEIRDDAGEDGVVDGFHVRAYDLGLDEALVYWGYDTDGEIGVDGAYNYGYNAEGRQVSFRFELGGDGTFESEWTKTYDAYGNELAYERDTNGDGVLDSAGYYTYEDGRLVSGELYQDEVLSLTFQNLYDAEGRLVETVTDDDADGRSDHVLRWVAYADDGSWLRFEEDDGADGTFELATSQTLDNEGRQLTLEVRTIPDNELVSATRTTWLDDHGSQDFASDDDGDGVDDYLHHHTYDEDGQLLYSWVDAFADGLLEYETTRVWHPDGYGPVEVETHDLYGVKLEVTVYDVDGRIATVRTTQEQPSSYGDSFDSYGDSSSSLETYTWHCP